MTPLHSKSIPRVPWLWAVALAAIWLTSAAALRQPWALEPGHFLYASDALLLAASALTCSGLSPVPIHGQLAWPGLFILAFLMQSGLVLTLYYSGRLALKLFPAFAPTHESVAPRILGTGLRVIFTAQALLVIALFLGSQGGWQLSSFSTAAFESISVISTTGLPITNALSPGVQFTGIGQAFLIPAFLLAALGAIPVGDAWRWAASRGNHSLHPVSRQIWTFFALSFLLGVLMITAVLLAPYSYQLLHLGMESGASDIGTVSKSIVQDAFVTGTYAAGPGRLGMSQPIEPGQSLPSYQFIMITLTFIGVAPLSLAGGISVLGAGALIGSGVAGWRRLPPSQCVNALTRWALSMLVFYTFLIAGGFLVLLISEPYPPMTLAADAVAAASNAGFSLGITSDVTSMGKVTLAAMMILGRLGPIYLALRFILQPPAQTH